MPIVYFGHYTTLTGLMGIVESELLWASNIKFLNDEHEFLHALELIKELVDNPKIATNDPRNSLYTEYAKKVRETLTSLDNYRARDVFTLSFSAETDLLSQWRGYCPNNNGYCLIFNVNAIYEATKRAFPKSHLFKCVYDRKEKETELKRLLNVYWQKFITAKSRQEKREMFEELAQQILLLASYFKHPSFAEEREHRIVILFDYAADTDLRFREGRFSLIPYIQLPAKRVAISKIVIGPTAHRELARRALEGFLAKCTGEPSFIGLTTPDIMYSQSPYRPW